MTAADHLPACKKARETFHAQGRPFPPHVLLERDGRPTTACWAPVCDKELGLKAAAVLRAALDPDALVFAADCYVRSAAAADVEAAVAGYARGSYQRDIEAGRRGDIRDALSIARVTRAGAADFAIVTYTLFEAGDPVYWDEAEAHADAKATGLIVDALRAIMTGPSLTDLPPFDQLQTRFGDVPADRRAYHVRRAAILSLVSVGFTVVGDAALAEDFR